MTTIIEHATEDELHRKLIASVESLGYMVLTREVKKVKLKEYASFLGRKIACVSMSIKRGIACGKCPPFRCGRGPTGKIIWIEPNPQLTEFLTP